MMMMNTDQQFDGLMWLAYCGQWQWQWFYCIL